MGSKDRDLLMQLPFQLWQKLFARYWEECDTDGCDLFASQDEGENIY